MKLGVEGKNRGNPPRNARAPAIGRVRAAPSLPTARVYLTVLFVAPVAALVTLLPHQLLWGTGLHGAWLDSSVFGFPWQVPRVVLVGGLVLSLWLHELLHAVGYAVFGKVPWSEIEIGAVWTRLVVYARCRVSLSREAYRGALLLPAVVLGAVPALLGLAFGLGWLTLYGFVLLVFASGDFGKLVRLESSIRGAVAKRPVSG